MKTLFVCGASVGHVAPAVAVWQALKEVQPDAESFFVCAPRKDEETFLAQAGVRFSTLPIPRLSVLFPIVFMRSFFGAWAIIGRENPDCVFSKGGALSVPVCIVARLQGIPVFLHESDAVLGTANKLIAGIAKAVFWGFAPHYDTPETSANMRPVWGKLMVATGNPVRPLMRTGSREEGLRITGFTGTRPIICINGGSQGAQVLNAWVIANQQALLAHCDIIHITGRGKAAAPAATGYWSREFVIGELPHLYAVTTLAITRAGAGTISELAATAVPAVLVPLPGLAHDHQTHNARRAEASGGCIVTTQDTLHDHLFVTVTSLLADRAKCGEMAARMRTLDHPSAARQIAEVMVSCLARSSQPA